MRWVHRVEGVLEVVRMVAKVSLQWHRGWWLALCPFRSWWRGRKSRRAGLGTLTRPNNWRRQDALKLSFNPTLAYAHSTASAATRPKCLLPVPQTINTQSRQPLRRASSAATSYRRGSLSLSRYASNSHLPHRRSIFALHLKSP